MCIRDSPRAEPLEDPEDRDPAPAGGHEVGDDPLWEATVGQQLNQAQLEDVMAPEVADPATQRRRVENLLGPVEPQGADRYAGQPRQLLEGEVLFHVGRVEGEPELTLPRRWHG